MNRFERGMLSASSLVVGLSGIVYAVMKYLMTTDDPYAVIHHPLQPLTLKIHIVTAPLLVFAIGAVFLRHIWEKWREGDSRGRISGLLTILTFAPMVFSGYLIQSVTRESWLSALVVVHLTTGGAFLLGFSVHRIGIAVRDRNCRGRKTGPPGVPRPAPGPSAAAGRVAVEPLDRAGSAKVYRDL